MTVMVNKTIMIQSQAFLDKWKPLSQELTKIKSIPDVFRHETPALSVIRKDYGHDFMVLYLAIWIGKVNSFTGGKMSEEDCKDTAETIFEDFYFLKVGDLKLIFKDLKKRKFIRITGNEIYHEIVSYFDRRCEFAQETSERESEANKSSQQKYELSLEELKQLYKDNIDGVELSTRPNLEKRTHEKIIEKEKADQKNLINYYRELRKQKPNPNID